MAAERPRLSWSVVQDSVLGEPAAPGERRRLRAIRGATTVDQDTGQQVTERTQALLQAMLQRNGVEHPDIVSVLFTVTDDVHSMFPATAARGVGFGDVPLICARELDIEGGSLAASGY